jgi:hypothetical protein
MAFGSAILCLRILASPGYFALGVIDVGIRPGGLNMDEKVQNIIPTLFAEIESDGENESDKLLAYYLRCNTQERDVMNNVLMYICGWTFETLLAKCGIEIAEDGALRDSKEEW